MKTMIKIHQRGRLIKVTSAEEERTITLYCQSAVLARRHKTALVTAVKTALCAKISVDVIMNNIWTNTI